MTHNTHPDARVAALVDCDNTSPEVLEHALKVVAQFGRVVLRRGYGNHGTLANKWQEALVRLAFTPCLQYQYASEKNTSDIALALDAIEALFDRRADFFCLVTSDSDFAYLCRKLRERGGTVHIVGEAKTLPALRIARDQFFEWTKPAATEPTAAESDNQGPPAAAKAEAPQSGATETSRQTPPQVHRGSGAPDGQRHFRGQSTVGRPWPVPQANRPGLLASSARALGAA